MPISLQSFRDIAGTNQANGEVVMNTSRKGSQSLEKVNYDSFFGKSNVRDVSGDFDNKSKKKSRNPSANNKEELAINTSIKPKKNKDLARRSS